MLPKKLHNKLESRKANNAFRHLGQPNNLIDFSSNDYLGFSKSEVISENTTSYIKTKIGAQNGATGSRLLSGNHEFYTNLENTLCEFHNVDAALVFNSGYDANLGFFASVPQRGDIILYDEYSHASIRDGIQLSNAKAYKFKHNNLEDLEKHLQKYSNVSDKKSVEIYIITESVFSMDGDSPDTKTLIKLSKKYSAHLVIDEAHAIGVFGQGLVDSSVFARIVTFGKALGCHGAAILGSQDLKDYLINFSRALIYTTALPPHSIATIQCAYDELISDTDNAQKKLRTNISYFQSELIRLQLQTKFITSISAIHCCIISGNKNVKNIAFKLQEKGFDVKPILSPTVPLNQERLRFCLHSYNSKEEITQVLELLATFVVSSI